LQELATTADMPLWPSTVKHLLLQNGTYQPRDIRSGSQRKRESEEREREAGRRTTMKMEMRTQVSRDTEAVGLDEGPVRWSSKPYFSANEQ
jgi:hypothetical protein